MKTRWRQHELVTVTLITVAGIIAALAQWYFISPEQVEFYAKSFQQQGLPFVYWKNVAFPQMGVIWLLFGCYGVINRFIVRPLVKAIASKNKKWLRKQIAAAILSIVILGYFLALGINALSWYARPHFFNYGGYQLLALFGYNDHPLTDLFFGFGRGIAFIDVFTGLAGMREVIIAYTERPGARREFRVMVLNNITLLAAFYFLIPFVLSSLDLTHEDSFYRIYFSYVTPILLLYIYNVYWLFPLKGEGSLFRREILIRLFLSVFICTLPSMFWFGQLRHPALFLMYYAFNLLITTPFTWLLYQQRKDKILQLRRVEKALVRSKADLQSLRAQINPHFLFNTLNTLYGTALMEKAEHTAEGIQRLGDMMRFMLHENNLDFIPMQKEIEYLKNYIALQKLRVQSSPGIQVEDTIQEQGCTFSIAPMLLIPFVENAFKHGISLKELSWINIRLHCDGSHIYFEVKNSVHVKTATDPERDQSGIGLENVKERLLHLYPGKHELNIEKYETEFIVRLSIQY